MLGRPIAKGETASIFFASSFEAQAMQEYPSTTNELSNSNPHCEQTAILGSFRKILGETWK
jgi:hypothetical protein